MVIFYHKDWKRSIYIKQLLMVFEKLCSLLVIRTNTTRFIKFVFAVNGADRLLTRNKGMLKSLNKINAPIKE